ncbi:MAG: hypothetical protein GON13_00960 [Nanoarchaeota archaeon]|nr:hypothetical protein [Nanoarchaeota archaeon]
MKITGQKLFAIFVTVIFVGPLLGLFFQNPSITGAVNYVDVIGGFKDTNKTAIYENESLVIWFFGTTTCEYCTWEKQVLTDVLTNFEKVTLKDYYLDSEYDMTYKISAFEISMFQEYNPKGYVPLLIIGNKYFKVGSGETNGYANEKQYLTQLISNLILNNDILQ